MSTSRLQAARYAFAAAATLALCTAAPAALTAQTPTVYHGCYVPLTGTVYRIKETNLKQTCTTGHVEFSWNARGAAGADGAQGPPGPAGGLSGWQVITRVATVQAGDVNFHINATCPVGKVSLSAGFTAYPLFGPGDPAGDLKLVNSVPTADTNHENISIWGWQMTFVNKSTTFGYPVSIQLVCATGN